MNHFNLCPSCVHNSYCSLTMQKDKVWSCSEYDSEATDIGVLEKEQSPKVNLKRKLEVELI